MGENDHKRTENFSQFSTNLSTFHMKRRSNFQKNEFHKLYFKRNTKSLLNEKKPKYMSRVPLKMALSMVVSKKSNLSVPCEKNKLEMRDKKLEIFREQTNIRPDNLWQRPVKLERSANYITCANNLTPIKLSKGLSTTQRDYPYLLQEEEEDNIDGIIAINNNNAANSRFLHSKQHWSSIQNTDFDSVDTMTSEDFLQTDRKKPCSVSTTCSSTSDDRRKTDRRKFVLNYCGDNCKSINALDLFSDRGNVQVSSPVAKCPDFESHYASTEGDCNESLVEFSDESEFAVSREIESETVICSDDGDFYNNDHFIKCNSELDEDDEEFFPNLSEE